MDSYDDDVCTGWGYEAIFDAFVTLVAIGIRLWVVVLKTPSLFAQRLHYIVAAQVIGVVASFVHFVLRIVVGLSFKSKKPPLKTLGGPQTIFDVISSILLIFSDAPLASTDDSRFSHVGRLIVSLLGIVSVFSASIFGSTTCTYCASSKNHKSYILIAATILWGG
mgnify:CR=1 FL=1